MGVPGFGHVEGGHAWSNKLRCEVFLRRSDDGLSGGVPVGRFVSEPIEPVKRGSAVAFRHGGIVEDVMDEVLHTAFVG